MPWYAYIALTGAVLVGISCLVLRTARSIPVCLALLFSSVGDTILGRYYVLGAAAFAIALICHTIQAFRNGKVQPACAVLTGGGLFLFLLFWAILPAWSSVPSSMKIVAIAYPALTAIAVGCTCSRRSVNLAAVFCCLGCLLLAISDIMLIAEHFLHYTWSHGFCIPIYVTSLVSAAIGGITDCWNVKDTHAK